MTREELWLAAIAGLDGVNPPDYPVWHYEDMLAAIYDAVVGSDSPRAFPARSWHLDEVLYAVYCAVAGVTPAPVCPEPTCRLEEFWVGILGTINGETVTVPTPVWRIEEFLKACFDASADWVSTLVSGNAPLTLPNAFTKPIKSLTQTGLCAQASTPTPSAPVPIKCNNGEIKFGKPLTIDSTRINAYISPAGTWVASSDSYSVTVPVEVGKKCAIRMTETDSGTVGTILRYGFTDSATPASQQLTQWVRTSPQDTQYVELTADGKYLVIQMTAGKFADNISNGYLVVNEQSLWVDGTPEVLTVTDSDSNTQTASVVDLFSVNSHADTQDVISGVVTHNVGIKVLNGTENWKKLSGQSAFYVSLPEMLVISAVEKGLSTHYNGTKATNANLPDNSIKLTFDSANGMILIKDTAYSTKDEFSAYLAAQYAAGTPVIVVYPLATPTTEQVAAQPLTTAVGTNTVSVTAEVSPIALSCEYYGRGS